VRRAACSGLGSAGRALRVHLKTQTVGGFFIDHTRHNETFVLLEFTSEIRGPMPLAAVLAEIRTDFLLFAFFDHEFAFG